MNSKLLVLSIFLVAACDDVPAPTQDGSANTDMGTSTDLPGSDDMSGPQPDGGPLAPATIPVVISPTGHDRLLGVAYDSAGNLYATGYVTAGTDANTDFSMVVAKFNAAGVLDTTFGQAGFAVKNVVNGKGGEVARGIVVQSTGKIVISGTIEHVGAPDERDRDTALVRFNANGTIDTTFGTMGVQTIDLSEGEVVTGGFVADTTYGLTKYAGNDDRMIMMSAQKRLGATDLDFAVVRVSADGVLDTTFNTTGIATLDIGNLGATPRTTSILADGSILAGGYLSDSGDNNIVKPVVWKLTSAGALDTTFGGGDGFFYQTVQGHTTEVYGFGLQGDKIVTVGYGKEATSDDLDWVSLRLNGDGTLDNTYGAAGVALVDAMGFNDNARTILLLPDNKILLIGGGRTSETNSDAMLARLTVDGALDTTFYATGKKSFDLGGASDFFWGAALSPDGNHIAIVGTKQVAAGMGNDDGALLLLPVTQ